MFLGLADSREYGYVVDYMSEVRRVPLDGLDARVVVDEEATCGIDWRDDVVEGFLRLAQEFDDHRRDQLAGVAEVLAWAELSGLRGELAEVMEQAGLVPDL